MKMQNKTIKNQFAVPILFISFNRPEVTRKTFDRIRALKPKKLYISVDGPRNKKEKKKVEEVRKIVSKIDWNCKVKKVFHNKNKGIKDAFCEAMDMMFKNEEYGIILEDDILTSEAFFDFCSKMLKMYKDDKRIMHVSGTNIQGITNTKENFFFSDRAFSFWGWATWKRAWEKHDKEIRLWPKIKYKFFFKQFLKEGPLIALKSYPIYRDVYNGKIQTADYQWDFACRIYNGHAIIPKYNLVQNIGFGKDSTHTTEIDASLPIQVNKPIKDLHKQKLKIHKKYGRFYTSFFVKKSFKRILKKLGF